MWNQSMTIPATVRSWDFSASSCRQCWLLCRSGLSLVSDHMWLTHSVLAKKFFPDETRSWKIFCMDIWKQLITAGFAHVLNVFLSEYVSYLTHVGNGCSWYLINVSMDLAVGIPASYTLFKIVDTIAIKFGIEVSSPSTFKYPIRPSNQECIQIRTFR